MNNSLFNRMPYLPSQRDYPDQIPGLVKEVFRSYVDIAQKVNERTIGIYPSNKPAVTGNKWFLTSEPLGVQRQVFPITTVAAGPYPHEIDLSQIVGFSHIYGTAYDGTIWYPLPYVDATSATDQIQLHVTSSDIVLTAGAGSPPAITQGYVVLEWLVRTSS